GTECAGCPGDSEWLGGNRSAAAYLPGFHAAGHWSSVRTGFRGHWQRPALATVDPCIPALRVVSHSVQRPLAVGAGPAPGSGERLAVLPFVCGRHGHSRQCRAVLLERSFPVWWYVRRCLRPYRLYLDAPAPGTSSCSRRTAGDYWFYAGLVSVGYDRHSGSIY